MCRGGKRIRHPTMQAHNYLSWKTTVISICDSNRSRIRPPEPDRPLTTSTFSLVKIAEACSQPDRHPSGPATATPIEQTIPTEERTVTSAPILGALSRSAPVSRPGLESHSFCWSLAVWKGRDTREDPVGALASNSSTRSGWSPDGNAFRRMRGGAGRQPQDTD
jgi:hypothetical protein